MSREVKITLGVFLFVSLLGNRRIGDLAVVFPTLIAQSVCHIALTKEVLT